MQYGTWSYEFGLPILDMFPGASLHLGLGWPPSSCHIRLQGSAATLGAPAILQEDSCPYAILKFHRPSSLEYRAHQGLLVPAFSYGLCLASKESWVIDPLLATNRADCPEVFISLFWKSPILKKRIISRQDSLQNLVVGIERK